MMTVRLDCTKQSDSCQGKQSVLGPKKKHPPGLSVSPTMDMHGTDHSPLQPSLLQGKMDGCLLQLASTYRTSDLVPKILAVVLCF